MPAGNEALFIGLISGTSRDGVDAALVSIENNRFDLMHAFCSPYPATIHKDLDNLLMTAEKPPAGKAAALDEQLGLFFARAANKLTQQAGVEKRDILAIGSHGQTVWHQPGGDRPVSLQLGNGSVIARSTGITTVTDFRKADLRAGGQGAPLAPLLHRHLFHSEDETRIVLNLGGIANITLLDASGEVSGFDCGPGNCLMDAWIKKSRGKEYDADGTWAASGKVNKDLLEQMLADPFFEQLAPKSTGLEYFNLGWLQSKCSHLPVTDQDLQCTIAELTATTIADSLPQSPPPARVLVCGGGVHNSHLMSRLASNLPGIPVESTQLHGADPDWVEAILFAWLAGERLAERRQNTGPITGARQPVLLGRIYHRIHN